ncbi:hypothetical protein DICPUDRAFT_77884 [Dictyostelium purpureum]|uniref:Uncharacterized protein n=1 Tax=Dictyostelium purpureum TaxID=5786 RepID=F0ZHX0_DICPU|nr:uncharacterized protein DICPUDRAFT_77884 [Dictyostelium purpureum]EGC36440.1 hypothetical protein DICPUDRAFT_77884 [Dictyostelium purpureum]|eukprot:XP_003287012.1 hypothetical protein DICPUDRAFT_77884 [Dictyostelium purpureum]
MCLNKNNIPVTSWYIFQNAQDSGSFVWEEGMTSLVSDENIRILENNIPIGSALLSTIKQLNNEKFSHVIYNNDHEKSNEDLHGAHSKGIFIWNEHGAIHIVHSLPNFPQLNFNENDRKVVFTDDPFSRKKTNGVGDMDIKDQHAQNIYCYTMDDGFKTDIYHFLFRINAIVISINGLYLGFSMAGIGSIFEYSTIEIGLQYLRNENIKKDFQSKIDLDFNKEDYINFKKNNKMYNDQLSEKDRKDILSELSTNTKFPLVYLAYNRYYFFQNDYLLYQDYKYHGMAVYSSSEYKKIKPILEELIGPIIKRQSIWDYAVEQLKTSNEEFYLQTQHYDDKLKGLIPVNENPPFKIIQSLNFEKRNLNRNFDHSKQMISKNIFCVGDLNYIDKQNKRGGSIICFENKILSQFFESYVYITQIKNEKDIIYSHVKKTLSLLNAEEFIKKFKFYRDSDNGLIPVNVDIDVHNIFLKETINGISNYKGLLESEVLGNSNFIKNRLITNFKTKICLYPKFNSKNTGINFNINEIFCSGDNYFFLNEHLNWNFFSPYYNNPFNPIKITLDTPFINNLLIHKCLPNNDNPIKLYKMNLSIRDISCNFNNNLVLYQHNDRICLDLLKMCVFKIYGHTSQEIKTISVTNIWNHLV